jgi:hypothetical protein
MDKPPPPSIRLRRKYSVGSPGSEVSDDDYGMLLTGDVDVYKPDGSRLIVYRRGVLSDEALGRARPMLRKMRDYKSFNRGTAAGSPGVQVVRADGKLSNTSRSLVGVRSSIFGYFDRYPRIPYCRQTAFAIDLGASGMSEVRPMLLDAQDCFRDNVPERYERQMQEIRATSKDFVLTGTPWTTLTVNYNWQTRLHTDRGDLAAGFGCITALRQGSFTGGLLVLPAFKVAVDIQNGDMLMFDTHEWHANTPIEGVGESGIDWERISVVFYYREKMRECGTAAEELARAKSLRGSLVPTNEDDNEQQYS